MIPSVLCITYEIQVFYQGNIIKTFQFASSRRGGKITISVQEIYTLITYNFKQIRKNDTIGWVPTPKPDINNPGHYLKYADCQGSPPNDEFLPSLTVETPAAVAESVQGVKASKLVNQNARSTIRCRQCQKPRVIYALKALTN